MEANDPNHILKLKFIWGLYSYLQQEMELLQIPKLEVAFQLTLKIEAKMQKRPKLFTRAFTIASSSKAQPTPCTQRPASNTRKYGSFHKCTGHTNAECRAQQKTRTLMAEPQDKQKQSEVIPLTNLETPNPNLVLMAKEYSRHN